ncbi:MAG: endonuclease [Albidovulum sp.]
MSESAGAACRRNTWLVALAGGVLVALMLLLLAGYGVLKALVIGLLFALLLGVFLVWAFCAGAAGTEAREVPPEPRPETQPESPSEARSVKESAAAPRPERASERGGEAPAPSAPPAFVSIQTGPRSAAVPEPARDATAVAERPAARKPASPPGLDAALAKAKDEPPAPAPEMLAAPRGGKADDLKQIRGIGPKLERLLNELGIWHFDQIAAWKAKDIAHVDELLVGFHGRITRDEWVKQAKRLAAGGPGQVSRHLKNGDVD